MDYKEIVEHLKYKCKEMKVLCHLCNEYVLRGNFENHIDKECFKRPCG